MGGRWGLLIVRVGRVMVKVSSACCERLIDDATWLGEAGDGSFCVLGEAGDGSFCVLGETWGRVVQRAGDCV